ncbi:MAG: sulfotransferase [Chloroflexi bacterium]|nr:sulfotransferase [Chloroflexota bacterium]
MRDVPIQRQVFIGGCSRSGTTLLGAMLGAHSACATSPESHFKMRILPELGGLHPDIDLSAALELIRKHWRFRIWEMDVSDQAVPAELLKSDYATLLNWLVARYAATQGDADATIWVDHTPENISYARSLVELFPQARIIHLVRDGRAVASSIMPLDWGPNTMMKAAPYWLAALSHGLAAERYLRPEQIIRVTYEDLVCYPEETLKTLCEFLEIDYQPAMASAGGFKPPDYTVSQHQLIGQAPNAARATKWERDLSPRQIEIFESLTRDFLHYLDYPLKYGLAAREPGPAETLWTELREFYRLGINGLRWLLRSYRLWLRR